MTAIRERTAAQVKIEEQERYRLNLSEANFRIVNLLKAHLVDSILSYTILDRADLKFTILNKADLRGADLTDANLYRAALASVDMPAIKAHYMAAKTTLTWMEKNAVEARM